MLLTTAFGKLYSSTKDDQNAPENHIHRKNFFSILSQFFTCAVAKFSSEVLSKDAQLYIRCIMIKREQTAVCKQLYGNVIDY